LPPRGGGLGGFCLVPCLFFYFPGFFFESCQPPPFGEVASPSYQPFDRLPGELTGPMILGRLVTTSPDLTWLQGLDRGFFFSSVSSASLSFHLARKVNTPLYYFSCSFRDTPTAAFFTSRPLTLVALGFLPASDLVVWTLFPQL